MKLGVGDGLWAKSWDGGALSRSWYQSKPICFQGSSSGLALLSVEGYSNLTLAILS